MRSVLQFDLANLIMRRVYLELSPYLFDGPTGKIHTRTRNQSPPSEFSGKKYRLHHSPSPPHPHIPTQMYHCCSELGVVVKIRWNEWSVFRIPLLHLMSSKYFATLLKIRPSFYFKTHAQLVVSEQHRLYNGQGTRGIFVYSCGTWELDDILSESYAIEFRTSLLAVGL